MAKVIAHETKLAVNNEDSSLAVSTKPTAGKKTPMGNRRPKAADYDTATRRILNTAINLYHVLLLTDNPFPDVQVELEFAKEAWDLSCEYYQSKSLSLDAGLISVVGDVREFDTTYLMLCRLLHVARASVGNSKQKHERLSLRRMDSKWVRGPLPERKIGILCWS